MTVSSTLIFNCRSWLVIAITIQALVPAKAASRICPQDSDFNCYILKAVDHFRDPKSGKLNKGWHGQADFMSQNFKYGRSTIIGDPGGHRKKLPEKKKDALSCNGAILEVLFKATELYQLDHPEFDIEKIAPAAVWTPTAKIWLAGPRAQLAMHNISDYTPFKQLPKHNTASFKSFDSASVAHAAERFGLGDQIKADQLKPGDVVTFDRAVKAILPKIPPERSAPGRKTLHGTGTTHSVIFLGWIDRSQTPNGRAKSFADAAGFEYFSSQGNLGGKSGMGVNWAYFGGKGGFCPQDKLNTVDPMKNNTYCPDQRKQDSYKTGAKLLPDYPWLDEQHGRKSDCCVNRHDASRQPAAGIKGGRFRSPDAWQLRERAAAIQTKFEALLIEAAAIAK